MPGRGSVKANQAYQKSEYCIEKVIENLEVFPLASQILDTTEFAAVGFEMAIRRSIDLNALWIEPAHSNKLEKEV